MTTKLALLAAAASLTFAGAAFAQSTHSTGAASPSASNGRPLARVLSPPPPPPPPPPLPLPPPGRTGLFRGGAHLRCGLKARIPRTQ